MNKTGETLVSRRGLFRFMAGRDPDPGPTDREAAAWPETAREALARGDLQTAADLFRAWLRRRPGDDQARTLLGRALYAQGRHVQALVEFERVTRRNQAHPAGFFLCLCRLRLGRTDKAPEAFRAGDGLDPDLADALAARIEAARADPSLAAAAADALEDALSKAPDLPLTAGASPPSPGKT